MKRPSLLVGVGAIGLLILAAIITYGGVSTANTPHVSTHARYLFAASANTQAGNYQPTLSGPLGANPSSPHPGDLFTTTNGTWSGSPTSYTYQWEDCDGGGNSCTAISGATSATYTVVSADNGSTLRSVVRACNNYGCAAASPGSTSAPTGLVAATGSAPASATTPVITGTTTQGSQLSVTTGTWSGSPTSYTYQWQDCDTAGSNCTNITGATSSTYTLVAGDVGKTVRVNVQATNAFGSATVSSQTTAVIAASGGVPVNSGLPVVSGTMTLGSTISTTNGSWTNSPSSYTYLWEDCNSTGSTCTSISGATAATYTLTSSDVGNYIRVVVTAHNSFGTGSALSAVGSIVATSGGSGGSGGGTGGSASCGTPTTAQCSAGIVSRLPDGPPTPSGGWTVEYADGFTVQPSTGNSPCAGCDTTYFPSHHNGSAACSADAPSNSNELDRYYCSQASVDSNGLELKCDATGTTVANQPYKCVEAHAGGANATGCCSGYKFVTYRWNVGEYWAFQMTAKFSPDFGANDQNFWDANAGGFSYEWDWLEVYGHWFSNTSSWCGGSSGATQMGVQVGTTPKNVSGLLRPCFNGKPTFDPSTAYHTYTFYFFPAGSGEDASMYVDGTLQAYGGFQFSGAGSNALPSGCGAGTCTAIGNVAIPPGLLGWQIQNTWRNYGTWTCSYPSQLSGCPWSTGTQTFSIRNLSFYENTTANNADVGNPQTIAPGTSLG